MLEVASAGIKLHQIVIMALAQCPIQLTKAIYSLLTMQVLRSKSITGTDKKFIKNLINLSDEILID